MDLSHPLATVLPGARGGVLALLAGTERPLTGRTVAALVLPRVSLRAAQNALDDLVRQGLVLRQVAGRAHLYTLNRDHLACGPLLELANLRQTLWDRIRCELAAWPVQAMAAWLFGSAARGTAGPASDLDLFLVRPDAVEEEYAEWQQQVSTLAGAVHAWTGNACEILEMSVAGLRDAMSRGDHIVTELRTDAVHLLGATPAQALATRAPR